MIRATNYELITIYSEREPYVIEKRLGNSNLVVFDDVFMSLILFAFETDCLSEMGERELNLFTSFIDYQDGLFSDVYSIVLDLWLSNLVNNIENPKIEGCGA